MYFKRGKTSSSKHAYSCPDLLIRNHYAKSKRSQVTIFIIIAIVLVAAIVIYFFVRSNIIGGGISADFKPVEESFISCINDYTEAGVALLEEQAGYIYKPVFEPGSEFMPSSNELNFIGTGIPFWYYVSGNNIVNEQVPSKNLMQEQLEKFIEENIICDFSSFRQKGYEINISRINVNVKILSDKVQVSVNSNLDIGLGDKHVRISEHKHDYSTKLGKFYDEAIDIYNYEKENMFLESYGLDVLYDYAPVTNAEKSCSPKIWLLNDVKTSIKQGLEANTIMLKTQADYYDSNKARKYFVTNLATDDAVQFLYSGQWPTKIETQDNDGVLIANPVGNQQGLGILGFCYINYHFVYDMTYPVLVQIYDDKEIFRFPVISIIKGNKERNPLPGTYYGNEETQLCQYKNADIKVSTYNTNLDPVEARISFKCFNEECDIGRTSLKDGEAILEGKFPQCVNGIITAKADGYEVRKQTLSSNEETPVDLILDKLYNVNINLKVDGKDDNSMTIIYFESDDTSETVIWPEQKSVNLSEGLYNISVFVYRNSTISIPESKTKRCVTSPSPGLLGVFGATTEDCFDLVIPGQTVTNAVAGGGKSSQYITESELQQGRADLLAKSLPIPATLEDLQNNYNFLEGNNVNLEFK